MDNLDYKKDLESNGITTSIQLRKILTTCEDPVETIKKFQSTHSIQVIKD